ncbi:tRNA pseudouridine(55) synthase TruB [Erysipelothrix inopinata]|uniref:tRNA pseudouridine synthase B n=1 Tax=Erysipelothrix inopinata TaxID=225084 RepID=A0A7G9RXM1_9FIRM|nr:tRNA pseudouridine(55) synthase TruB [Erysipelothrix inopinata]QNN60346.1 tRNA pseudouridine(55) synthase TruB [Erysipelothrix inopinata]
MKGLLCINKPQDMTSFDVVAKVRRIMNAKVGHAGTLDPMATGLLIIAVNQATKALPYLGLEDKVYHGKCQMGQKTSTGDIWGDVIEEKPVQPFTEAQILEVFQSLTGPLNQRVPKVSAKKVDGKRSYDYVFENKEVKQLYTDIEIYKIELLSFDENTIEFLAHVSNGTYIRTLCEDIAEKLNNLGSMSYLERTRVGNLTLDDAISIDEIQPDTKLWNVKDSIALPKIINDKLEDYVKNGKRLKLNTPHDQVLVDAGEYYAVYQREKDETFKSVRGLW